MNALLKKEIRLLLPSWAIAMVLALSASLVADHSNSTSTFRVYVMFVLPFLAGPAMVVMLSLDSFGRELSAGTFPNLLAQPLARSRIWWMKALLLAAALLSVWAVWWICVATNRNLSMHLEQQREMLRMTLVLVAVAYSGGLWTVLALRQVAAAFWFTLLIPGMLSMVTLYFTKEFGGDAFFETRFPDIVTWVLLAYSVAGFLWAHRLFLRAQDVQWTGGEISLPDWWKLSRRSVRVARLQGHRPKLALLAKELQLHQSQFIIVGALALLHLGLIVARNVSGGFKGSPGLHFVSHAIWALWPLMGLLIGCAAVSEERKLGTLEAQLCLPARRRTQFAIKFGVALMLAVIFGVAVPLLFEGRRVLPDLALDSHSLNPLMDLAHSAPALLGFLRFVEPLLPFLPQTIFTVLFLCMAFYASTLTRTTLQAIAPAIIGAVVAVTALFGAPHVEDLIPLALWRGGLIYIIGVPVITVTLGALALWNFKRVLVGWPVWRLNLWVFAATLVAIASLTTAIYQRTWELFSRLEPVHNAARLTDSSGVRLRVYGQRISALSSDGQAWSAWILYEKPTLSQALISGWYAPPPVSAGRFLEGTNWASVAYGFDDIMALQRDGDLWVSEESGAGRFVPVNNQWLPPKPVKLVRYGSDTDWKNLVGGQTSVLALKSDGTLWRIGTNRFSGKRPWLGWRSYTPHRIGTNTDWAEILSLDDSYYNSGRTVLRKTDGRIYVSPPFISNAADTFKLDDEMTLEHVSYLEQSRWRGLVWTSGRRGGTFQVGVAEDGKLYVLPRFRPEPSQLRLPLGHETNWVAVAGNYGETVTLKSDGTLWAWHFPEYPETNPQSAYATRLGEHSDWRAITGEGGSIIALAADGSLWSWVLPDQGSQQLWPLLRPTRRPQLLGNIFAQAE